ncbi:MAG: efflux RND transporter periplasmic adaptor subunit [Myxococcota bacterium]
MKLSTHIRRHAARGGLRKPVFLAAAMLLVAGLTACDEGEGGDQKAAASSRGPMNVNKAVVVETVTAKKEPFSVRGDYAGEFVADRQADVAFEVQGRIVDLELDIGSPVEEGDVLAEIDATKYRQSARELSAALNMAKASAGDAEVAIENLEQELARKKPLLETQVISEREVEDLEARIRQAKQKLTVARAQQDQAAARLQNARENVRNSKIRAPFDGKIATRYVDLGTFVSPTQPVFRVVSGDVYLKIDVPEGDASAIAVGEKVSIRMASFGGRDVPGEVARIAPAFDSRTRSLRVDIAIDEDALSDEASSKLTIRPGMYAQAQIELGNREDALTVPKQAILEERDGAPYIWAVVDGVAEKRQLLLGLSSRSKAEVVEGLEPGTRIVLRGFDKLEPGTEVQPLDNEVGPGETPSTKNKQTQDGDD